MEQEIINQAKLLYAFNAGAYTKEECLRQAIKNIGVEKLTSTLALFDITVEDFIRDSVIFI